MLTKQNKLDIYALLCSEFPKKKAIPMKDVQAYLENNGLSYAEFGYRNMRSLLEDLQEFLALGKSPGTAKKKDPDVTFHDYVETPPQKETKPKKTEGKKEKPDLKAAIRKALEKGRYQKDKEYPLATISKTLRDDGIDCHAFGFGKMKNLFLSMPEEFEVRNVEMNGVMQPWIRLKETKPERPQKTKADILKTTDKLIPVPAKKARSSVKAVKKETIRAKVEKKEDGSENFFVPDKLLLSLKEMAALGLDDKTIVGRLQKDYASALSNRQVERRPEGIVFPLSFLNRNGETLIGAIRKADSQTGYAYFLNFVGVDKDKPKDYLRQMVNFSDYEESIATLAKMAKAESWCYKGSKDKHIILKIFLQYTFYRLVSQKKIMVDEASGFVSFNTGLVTEDYDPIYAVLILNRSKTVKEDYLFQGFTVAGSQGLGKIVVERFSPLPAKATYIDDPSDLLPKDNMQIHTDYRHILLDNLDRLPLSFLANIAAPFEGCRKIVDQIGKEKNPFKIQRLYANLSEKLQNDDLFYNLLRTSLEMAISKGLSMLRYDYRMVLPSFFPTRNVLSFMVPLSFGRNHGKVDAVLLIEKMPSGNYQGQTILTLKQCYVNSRLISPLQNTYLKAEEIED